MVYEHYRYKINGLFPVPAQVAGEELHRIYQERGELQAADIVDESRPDNAPLHPCFEWDDFKAAELYRQKQARSLIECIVTEAETPKNERVEVRAYLHTSGSYHHVESFLKSVDMHQELIKSAVRDLEVFQRRLDVFMTLKPVAELGKAVNKTITALKEGE